ncbi:hypothetical protein [Bacillus mycoides]|uniref:hypothetical protein n=1 Tax=Bacillus mycoides TaxID=1405 RepID=UPI003A808FAE
MKQRWRKTKVKTKPWVCDGCGFITKVEKDYEPKMCCNGYECGCFGMPIEPVFCDSCEERYYGSPNR